MCEKCDNIKSIVEEWINKQGHDKCWYYPDLFHKLIKELNIKLSLDQLVEKLPTKEGFKAGCDKYIQETFG
jgi:hypothetical protein